MISRSSAAHQRWLTSRIKILLERIFARPSTDETLSSRQNPSSFVKKNASRLGYSLEVPRIIPVGLCALIGEYLICIERAFDLSFPLWKAPAKSRVLVNAIGFTKREAKSLERDPGMMRHCNGSLDTIAQM